MNDRATTEVQGIVGNEATAAKRGYYYQDLVTLEAWLRLKAHETLLIEVAEDVSIEGEAGHLEVVQVKDVGRSLTLLSALGFLDNVVRQIELNPRKPLSFVYRTSAAIGREKQRKHQPGGLTGIAAWKAVQSGANPSALINVLKDMADKAPALSSYLQNHSDAEIVEGLIQKVSWATSAADTGDLIKLLREEIAEFAYKEAKYEKFKGRDLLATLVNHVTRISTSPGRGDRALTRADLVHLVQQATLVWLTPQTHEQLQREASVARALDRDRLGIEISERTTRMRTVRFFAIEDAQEQALQLSADLLEGALQAAQPPAKAEALAWCARVLIERDEKKAESLLDEAEALEASETVSLARVLLLNKSDRAAALRMLSGFNSAQAKTIRLFLERAAPEGMLTWLDAVKLPASAFDPDGQFFVLNEILQAHAWDRIPSWLDQLQEPAFEGCPALAWSAAYALVALSTAEGDRATTLLGPPVLPGQVILDDSRVAISMRRRAASLFRRFGEWAGAVKLLRHQDIAVEYALFLELEDPTHRARAREQLRNLRAQHPQDPRWIPLALRADLPVDGDAVRREIRRHFLEYAALTPEHAVALLAVLLTSSAESWIDSWADWETMLSGHIAADVLDQIKVQAYAYADRPEEAQRALSSASLTAEVREFLRLAIEAPSREDAVERWKRIAEQSPDPQNFRRLASAMARARQFMDALGPARTAYAQTRSREDARQLAELLYEQGQWQGVVDIFIENPALDHLSDALTRLHTQALLNLGRWQDALSVGTKHGLAESEVAQLELEVAVLSGRWDRLGRLMEDAALSTELTSEARLRYAHIALVLGNRALAKRLTHLALDGESDPRLLFNGYTLAVKGGWENESEVTRWLQSAIDSAEDDEGPVRRGTLKELVEKAPEWHARQKDIRTQVDDATMFLAVATQLSNQPLSQVLVGQASHNLRERDPARRRALPTFAAVARKPIAADAGVALDITALLTLAQLDLLGHVRQAFNAIYLPHSLGPWLLSELDRAAFHQPSKVDEARDVLDAIARGDIRIAKRSSVTNPRLQEEFGVELERLIGSRSEDSNAERAFIVENAPIYRPGSLMNVESDTAEYGSSIRSLLSVAQSLVHYGVISEEVAERAQTFLRTVDRGWTDDQVLPPDAVLYLTQLSLHYLSHVELLSPCLDAGFELVVDSDVRDEANAYRMTDVSGEHVSTTLERIRRLLALSDHDPKVRMLPRPPHRRRRSIAATSPMDTDDESAGEKDFGNPESSLSLLRQVFVDVPELDCLVIDDRAANRYPEVTNDVNRSLPVASSLELLDVLQAQGLVAKSEWLRARTQLRRAGYVFVPLAEDELIEVLASSRVRNGQLVESQEARAVRENYLIAQFTELLAVPLEAQWVAQSGTTIRKAVERVWAEAPEAAESALKASWLVELARMDGFTSRFLGDWDASRWVQFDAIRFSGLLWTTELDRHQFPGYNEWLDAAYLNELRRRHPALFSALCDMTKRAITGLPTLADGSEIPEGMDTKAFTQTMRAKLVNALPDSVRAELMKDADWLDHLGVERSRTVTLHIDGSPRISVDQLYQAAGEAIEGVGGRSITDSGGGVWALSSNEKNEVWAQAASGSSRFEVRHAALLAAGRERRQAYLRTLEQRYMLPPRSLHAADEAPLEVDLLDTLERDLEDTPAAFTQKLLDALRHGEMALHQLVPFAQRYYERLAGQWSGQESVIDFSLQEVPSELGSNAEEIFGFALLRSAHSLLVPIRLVQRTALSELEVWTSSLLPHIDLWSLTGLVEALLKREDALTDGLPIVEQALDQFLSIVNDRPNRFALTAALAAHTDASLHVAQLFPSAPPFWRRLASIAHAGVIERAIVSTDIDLMSLQPWLDQTWPTFQSATLGDLPAEGRWHGHLMRPRQLRHELIGRVMVALQPHRDKLQLTSLGPKLFGEAPASLEHYFESAFAGLPGPLEGSSTGIPQVPEPLLQHAETGLQDATRNLLERIVLAGHITMLGRVSKPLLDRIALAVREFDASPQGTGELDLESVLVTLAMAAAGNRHTELAKALEDFLAHRSTLPVPLKLHVGLTACGAYDDIEAWGNAVAQFVRRIVSAGLSRDDAAHVSFVLTTLCEVRASLRIKLTADLTRLRVSAERVS
jgi:hypothetical protein